MEQDATQSIVGRSVWGLEQGADDGVLRSAREIESYLGCHSVVAQLLWGRGLRTAQSIERFLRPELSHLPSPHSIIDMSKAVDRALEAIANEEKIAIYGDYDVDGTCGAALLSEFFRGLGAEPIVYQPNRFTEGYGVHSAAIEKLIDDGAQLIITVDCGITAVEPARLTRSRGVDMIVLDHHKAGAELPPAFAVVDPQRPEDESGLLNLCGAGIAFFFVMALRAGLREAGFFEDRAEPNLARLLDLVAIATVADVVDIRGVNRILVAHGLRVMNKTPRVGIKAMLEAAGVERVTAMHCGFVLGPRINAAGRLRSARSALDLLTSTDAESARALAHDLEEINKARRETQDEVHRQAREQALEQLADPRWKELAEQTPGAAFGAWPRALVLAASEGREGSWHEGVVGIVASKIVEEFGRPAFVLSSKEGSPGTLKGSVRSISKIDILAAISADSVARHLINYGGHAHAGGVTLLRESLNSFAEAINLHMAITAGEEHYRRERRHDAEVELDEINGRLVEELKALEPFGHKFPEPLLKVSGVSAVDVRVMKEKHLKIKLARPGGASGALEAVWFNAATKVEAGASCSLWVSPQWNEWQGVKRLQLQVKHLEV